MKPTANDRKWVGGTQRTRHSHGAGAVSLQPVGRDDEVFLMRVFESTREVERQSIQWAEGEWESFIELQVRAQHAHYVAMFPAAHHDVILLDSLPVGRIWVHHARDEIRLLDIALLPEWRGQGIGTRLIRALQNDARRLQVPLRHSVEAENTRARQLYERLGFVATDTHGLHTLMEWNATQTTSWTAK